MASEGFYPLPSHPDQLCLDRFSILDLDDEHVRFWFILQVLLSAPIVSSNGLIDLLETISVTVRGESVANYGILVDVIDSLGLDFFSAVWPVLSRIARDMPTLFPDHTLPVLTPHTPALVLSRAQVACIVVHQFLGTLKSPVGRDGPHDFSIWFSSEQRHPNAAKIYLTSLFTYFKRLISEQSPLTCKGWNIVFRLVSQQQKPRREHFLPLEVIHLCRAATEPEYLGLPDGACVISANKVVGFGESGTQEEIQVAASPESCPVVLITRPLEDSQVLVVQGAEEMIIVTGHGRDISYSRILHADNDPEKHFLNWQNRTMLFMDALELDTLTTTNPSHLADLLPGNVARELIKAHTAFASGSYSCIYTGFWGCGAFGGHPDIKAIVQWCASSAAGSRLRFVCSTTEQSDFGHRLEYFVSVILQSRIDIGSLEAILCRISPEDIVTTSTSVFQFLLTALFSRQEGVPSAA